jgi:hypothetical protein
MAVIQARKRLAWLLCALILTGCQLYWRKPGADLAAFTADHHACAAKAGADVGDGHILVNLDVYRGCLQVRGWQRETGSVGANPPGFYRGLEDEGPIRVGDAPKQVGETEGAATAVTSSREIFCRRAHLELRTDWRDRLSDYQACLGEGARGKTHQ